VEGHIIARGLTRNAQLRPALTGGLSGPSLGAQTRTQVGFTLHKPSEENERSEIALDFHLILGFARSRNTYFSDRPTRLARSVRSWSSRYPDWIVSISSLAPATSITLRVRTQNASGGLGRRCHRVLGADELSQHVNKRELRLTDKSQFEFPTSS
jgi:hypothetical protein